MNFKNPKRNQEHISNGGSVSIQQSRTLTEYSRYEHKFGNIYLSHTHTHARTNRSIETERIQQSAMRFGSGSSTIS